MFDRNINLYEPEESTYSFTDRSYVKDLEIMKIEMEDMHKPRTL